MNITQLSINQIIVPPFVERGTSKKSDQFLRESIEKGGIQQPLIVVADGDRYLLAKGLRRLRVARSLNLGKVPVMIDEVPKGYTAESHVRRLRFHLIQFRQDLTPSQRSAFITELKTRFGMNNRQVAVHLGVNYDTITNWLAVEHYLPPIVAAIDAGSLSTHAARVFDGMSEEGQRHVWKEQGRKMVESSTNDIHKELRTLYPPENYPTFYTNPERSRKMLARPSKKRKAAAKPAPVSKTEKKKLQGNLEMVSIELAESEGKRKQYEAEINAAIIPIQGIMRNERLRRMVPAHMREELERFVEIFC